MSPKSPLIASPVVVVKTNATIAECVRIMRDQGIGALLVVSDDEKSRLVGIFTERDLLKKIDLIQKGDHWDKPVHTVMTKHVRTLTPDHVNEAPVIMLRHRFRHLPIVTRDEAGKEHIIAVISMRDLFESLIAEHGFVLGDAFLSKLIKKESHATTRIAVLANDSVLYTTIKESISGIASIKLKRFRWRDADLPEVFLDEISGYRAVLIDIDFEPATRWAPVLTLLNKQKDIGKIIVAYDPALHSLREIDVMEKLDASGRVSVFAKPVNIGTLLNRL